MVENDLNNFVRIYFFVIPSKLLKLFLLLFASIISVRL